MTDQPSLFTPTEEEIEEAEDFEMYLLTRESPE